MFESECRSDDEEEKRNRSHTFKKTKKENKKEKKTQLPRARLPKRPKRSCSIYLLCT